MVTYSIWRMDRSLNTPTLWKNFIFVLFNQFQKETTTKTNKHCAVTSWHFFLNDKISEMWCWNGSYYQNFLIKSLRLLNLTSVLHITLIRTLKNYFLFSYLHLYPPKIAIKNFPCSETSINFERALLINELINELQTPDWSHFKEFKQLFKLRPIWGM